VNGRAAAGSGEWAEHFSNASCSKICCSCLLIAELHHKHTRSRRIISVAVEYLQFWMETVYRQVNAVAFCEPVLAHFSCFRFVSSSLAVPHARTNYSDCSFAVYGPRVWNSLPDELRSTDIKTSLVLLVMVSEHCCRWRNTFRSLLKDDERLMPVHWLASVLYDPFSALTLLVG